MVLERKQTTYAYRCPDCGTGVISAVDVFALSAPMVKLKCTCGRSESVIERTRDEKIRITVPCTLCPNSHTFLLSPSLFFGKEEFFLNCNLSDLNIGFLGDADHVKANLAKSELDLLKLFDEYGVEGGFPELRRLTEGDPDEDADSELANDILFVLCELEEEGRIFCKCDRNEERGAEIDKEKYGFERLPYGIRVVCRDCGASRIVPADNSIAAFAFLDADSLHLE